MSILETLRTYLLNAKRNNVPPEKQTAEVLSSILTDEVLNSLTFISHGHPTVPGDKVALGDLPSDYNDFSAPMCSLSSLADVIDDGLRLARFLINTAETEMTTDDLNGIFLTQSNRVECPGCGEQTPYCINLETLTIEPSAWWEELLTKQDPSYTLDCPHPEPLPQTITLPTPSKKLVLANDLRKLFPERDTTKAREYIAQHSQGRAIGINSDLGTRLNADYWAQQGLFYFQVAHSSPSIMTNDSVLVLSTSLPDEFEIDIDDNPEAKAVFDADVALFETLEKQGYVCTDLWAVTAMDHDDFVQRAREHLDLNEADAMKQFDATCIALATETLSLTSYYELLKDDSSAVIVKGSLAGPELTAETKTSPSP